MASSGSSARGRRRHKSGSVATAAADKEDGREDGIDLSVLIRELRTARARRADSGGEWNGAERKAKEALNHDDDDDDDDDDGLLDARSITPNTQFLGRLLRQLERTNAAEIAAQAEAAARVSSRRRMQAATTTTAAAPNRGSNGGPAGRKPRGGGVSAGVFGIDREQKCAGARRIRRIAAECGLRVEIYDDDNGAAVVDNGEDDGGAIDEYDHEHDHVVYHEDGDGDGDGDGDDNDDGDDDGDDGDDGDDDGGDDGDDDDDADAKVDDTAGNGATRSTTATALTDESRAARSTLAPSVSCDASRAAAAAADDQHVRRVFGRALSGIVSSSSSGGGGREGGRAPPPAGRIRGADAVPVANHERKKRPDAVRTQASRVSALFSAALASAGAARKRPCPSSVPAGPAAPMAPSRSTAPATCHANADKRAGCDHPPAKKPRQNGV